MAAVVELVPFLFGLACLTLAQGQETTTHINPHLPVTTESSESGEQTTQQINLYKGRPLSTVQFGENNDTQPVEEETTVHHTTHHTTEHTMHPTTHTTEVPQPTYTIATASPTHRPRWPGIHLPTERPTYTAGVGTHGDVSGYGHHTGRHRVVHVHSSETNNWNHAVHHEFQSGQNQKNYSKTTINGVHPQPDSSSSSGSHSGSGGSHGSSGSGESGPSGSGESSASGSE